MLSEHESSGCERHNVQHVKGMGAGPIRQTLVCSLSSHLRQFWQTCFLKDSVFTTVAILAQVGVLKNPTALPPMGFWRQCRVGLHNLSYRPRSVDGRLYVNLRHYTCALYSLGCRD